MILSGYGSARRGWRRHGLVTRAMHPHVRFGSLADICSAKRHVRSTPNSDRESEIPQNVMSALPPKADMCGALAYVCFGPIADIGSLSLVTDVHRKSY
jgi:hypothetical protein